MSSNFLVIKSHILARKHLKQNSEYQKRHYDLKAVKRTLQVGQPVWLYDASKKVGVCHKLTSKWKGPYVITRKLDDITYSNHNVSFDILNSALNVF
jgi:hypothetical protein